MKLFPTGSFYGLAKIHELSANQGVEKFSPQSINSNINAAIYELVRYLAKTLAALICSEYTVSISKEFADLIRRKCVFNIYKLVSFDVKSLFNNLPLETTINVILRRIYADKEISTNAQVKDMKDRAL